MPRVLTPLRPALERPAAERSVVARPARALSVSAQPVSALAGMGRAASARAAVARAALVVAAAVLVAGCAGGSPGPSRGTVASCYAFAVHDLDRHVVVTSLPPACRGLSHEQINVAADRAIRAVAGPHRKAIARRLDHKEAAYLSYLITVVPPRAQPSPAPAPSQPSSRLPLDIAALAAWAVTVAAGARLLAGWILRGGLRRRYARVAGVPRAVIAGHFILAVTGLTIWIVYLATGLGALAWAAVVVVLAVAGLGMATLAGGLPEMHPASAAEPPATDPASAGPASAAPAGTKSGGSGFAGGGGADDRITSAGPAGGTRRARVVPIRVAAIEMPAGKPLPLIALHGALASATILLVVLAAIGAG